MTLLSSHSIKKSVDSLFVTTKPTWSDPEQSLGRECSKISGLRCWEVTGPALDIMNQLSVRIKELLDKHQEILEQGELKPRAISFHMWMIGSAADAANPTIVFSSKSRRQRTFAKVLLKESKILSGHPGVKIKTLDKAPAIYQAAESRLGPDRNSISDHGIYMVDDSRGVCGSLVAFGSSRLATMGGVILINGVHYGISAQHARFDYLRDYQHLTNEPEDVPCFDDDSDSEYCDLNIETSKGSESSDSDHTSTTESLTSDSIHADSIFEPPYSATTIDKVGLEAEETSYTPQEPRFCSQRIADIPVNNMQNDLDYEIFQLDDPRFHTVNNIKMPTMQEPARILSPSKPARIPVDTEVWVVTGTTGSVRGTMTSIPHYMKMEGSGTFQEMWAVHLDRKTRPGDCGAWVIDAITGSIYGHVIAGDLTSSTAYIIPAYKIFDDIEDRFGVPPLLPSEPTPDPIQKGLVRSSKPIRTFVTTPRSSAIAPSVLMPPLDTSWSDVQRLTESPAVSISRTTTRHDFSGSYESRVPKFSLPTRKLCSASNNRYHVKAAYKEFPRPPLHFGLDIWSERKRPQKNKSSRAVPLDDVLWNSTADANASNQSSGKLADSKIAIVGMSGRFSAAALQQSFWELLEDPHISKLIPKGRFDEARIDRTRQREHTSRTPYGHFIDEPGLFDARFFGMSPREATQTDPMHRLALLTTYEALEMSGYVSNTIDFTKLHRFGSFYGQSSDDWRKTNQAQKFVIHGLGGIGKTQLSVEFARKYQERYTAVFWVDSSTTERLRQSIGGLARRLPQHQLSEESRSYSQNERANVDCVVKDVLNWLSQPSNDQRLLIFDNVDREFPVSSRDPEAFDIEEHFPTADQGSIFITSRLASLEQLGSDMKLEPVSELQGESILENGLGQSMKGSLKLVSLLQGLPLAINQAGSFMRKTDTGTLYNAVTREKRWPLHRSGLLGNLFNNSCFRSPQFEYRDTNSIWNDKALGILVQDLPVTHSKLTSTEPTEESLEHRLEHQETRLRVSLGQRYRSEANTSVYNPPPAPKGGIQLPSQIPSFDDQIESICGPLHSIPYLNCVYPADMAETNLRGTTKQADKNVDSGDNMDGRIYWRQRPRRRALYQYGLDDENRVLKEFARHGKAVIESSSINNRCLISCELCSASKHYCATHNLRRHLRGEHLNTKTSAEASQRWREIKEPDPNMQTPPADSAVTRRIIMKTKPERGRRRTTSLPPSDHHPDSSTKRLRLSTSVPNLRSSSNDRKGNSS